MLRDGFGMTARPSVIGRVVTATITLVCVLIVYDGWANLTLRDVVYVVVGPVVAIVVAHVFASGLVQHIELERPLTRREWLATGRIRIAVSSARRSPGRDPGRVGSRRCRRSPMRFAWSSGWRLCRSPSGPVSPRTAPVCRTIVCAGAAGRSDRERRRSRPPGDSRARATSPGGRRRPSGLLRVRWAQRGGEGLVLRHSSSQPRTQKPAGAGSPWFAPSSTACQPPCSCLWSSARS